MRPTLVFLPSALLGPAVWRPVAAELADRGWDVVETNRPDRAPSTPGDALETYRAGLPTDRPLVLLPPWTRWWGESDVAVLFPDDAARGAVEVEQHRLPLDYFDGVLPANGGWSALPVGYLAFGETYADDRAAAADRGWAVTTLTGQHLHMLVAPVEVADSLGQLVSGLRLA